MAMENRRLEDYLATGLCASCHEADEALKVLSQRPLLVQRSSAVAHLSGGDTVGYSGAPLPKTRFFQARSNVRLASQASRTHVGLDE